MDQLQQHERRLKSLEATLEEVRSGPDKQATAQNLTALSQQFSTSVEALQRAQQQQQEQMRQNMDELKAIVLASRDVPDHAKKPRKSEAASPMMQLDHHAS